MRTLRLASLALTLTAILGFSAGPAPTASEPAAEAAALKVTWLDRADGPGFDQINGLCRNNKLIFAAARGIAEDGSEQFVVRAYDLGNGAPKWIQHYDAGFGKNVANAVAADNDRVYAVGRVRDETGSTDRLTTVAYDSKTGAHLWGEEQVWEGYSNANSVATAGGRVFVAGTGRLADVNNVAVTAFDGKTGGTLWEDWFNDGGGDGAGYEVAATTSGVFVVGYVETASGEKEFAVRAYDPATGNVLWSDFYANGGTDNRAFDVAASNDMVVAAGMAHDDAGQEELVVRAYEPRTGLLLWQEQDPGLKSSAQGLAIQGDKVFVCGVAPLQYFVRTYSRTGSLLWEDSFDNEGWFDFDLDVVAEGKKVAVVAYNQTVTEAGEFAWEIIVRAYKSSNGLLLMDQRDTGPGLNGEVGLLLKGNKVFAAGAGGELQAAACAPETPDTTKVTISGRDILVNGTKFFAKGVGYSPRPIGSAPGEYCLEGEYGDYSYTKEDGSGWQTIWQRDIPKMKEMGVNLVRIYGWHAWLGNSTHDPISHKDFLDELHANGMYAVPEFYMECSHIQQFNAATWATTDVGKDMMASLAAGKDHPAVLGWVVGNEKNCGGSYWNSDYWTKYNGLVGLAKQKSPDKAALIAVVDDSMQTVESWDSLMTSLDIWGINSYRGRIDTLDNPFGPNASAFDVLFSTYKSASQKPLLLTEFGPPASTHSGSQAVLLPSNGKGTADYLEVHWNRSPRNPSDDILHNKDVCSGGIVFAWSDEWWKSGNSTQHDPGSSANGAFPGGWGDEEWFGICGVQLNGREASNMDESHPDTLLPRAAFDRLKTLWAAGE